MEIRSSGEGLNQFNLQTQISQELEIWSCAQVKPEKSIREEIPLSLLGLGIMCVKYEVEVLPFQNFGKHHIYFYYFFRLLTWISDCDKSLSQASLSYI